MNCHSAGPVITLLSVPFSIAMILRGFLAADIPDLRPTPANYLERYCAGVTASGDVTRDFAVGVLPVSRDFVTEAAYRKTRDLYLPALRES